VLNRGVPIVTHASHGLGLATALAREAAKVAIVVRAADRIGQQHAQPAKDRGVPLGRFAAAS